MQYRDQKNVHVTRFFMQVTSKQSSDNLRLKVLPILFSLGAIRIEKDRTFFWTGIDNTKNKIKKY